MAPKGQKRPPTETKKAVAAKKTKVDVAAESENPTMIAINTVIQEDENLSKNCRNMLMAGIRGSLMISVDDRHEAQKLVVGMVNEVMGAKEAVLQKALDEAKAAEAAMSTVKTDLNQQLAAAETALVEKTNVVDEKRKGSAAAAEGATNAKAVLSEKEDLQRTGDATMEALRTGKAEIEKAMEQTLKTIAEGESTVTELINMLQRLKFDESLIVALPGTCARAPSDRGPFDSMVLNQLETGLKHKLEEMSKALEAEAPAVQARAKDVEEAQAQLVTAEAQKTTATEELALSETPRCEAAAAVDAVKAALAGHEPKEVETVAMREDKARALEAFRTNVGAPFAVLRDATAISTAKAIDPPESPAGQVAPPVESPAKDAAPGESPAPKELAPELEAAASVAIGGA